MCRVDRSPKLLEGGDRLIPRTSSQPHSTNQHTERPVNGNLEGLCGHACRRIVGQEDQPRCLDSKLERLTLAGAEDKGPGQCGQRCGDIALDHDAAQASAAGSQGSRSVPGNLAPHG